MRLRVGIALFGLLCAGQVAAQNGDLGTPVLTPPILNQPAQGGGQLVVPPSANPPPAQPAQPPQQSAPADAAPAAQQATRTMSTQAFEDWTLECYDPAFDVGRCQIVSRVLNANQVVMVFALAAPASDAPANIQIALPLGIALGSGTQLVIGDSYQNQIAPQRCTPQGCLIEGIGSAELVSALKRELTGTVVVQDDQGRKIPLPFSLKGFTSAFDAMVQ